jgi:filamentous hemagglutinin family protein
MTSMASLLGQTRVTLFVAILSLVMLMSPAISQPQTTNITESGLNTRVTTSGTTTFIDGGTRPGSASRPNLFHSFGDFSIGTGDTALFRAIDVVGGVNTAYSGSSIQNIIGRVTGNNPSSLSGTLDTISNFPTANLFLVNPNGILFGANSNINVGGSANFVAGDYLRMTDNALFFANPAQTSTLSVATVSSFGFLAGNPLGTISIEGGTVRNTSALTLVGRDIVDGNGNTTTPGILLTGGTLSNSDGRINLVSVGLPQDLVKGGEIQATSLTSAPIASGHAFNTMGEIKLSRARIDTSGTTGGSVVIRGEQMTIDNGAIIAQKTGNTSDSPAGIDIKLDGAFALNTSETIFETMGFNTHTSGAGDGGAIKIAASKVTLNYTGEQLFRAAVINSGTSGAGNGGDVVITATGDVSLHRVAITSDTVEVLPFGPVSGTGNAGSIVIKGENVTVTDSQISTNGVLATGNTGALEIETTSSVKLIGTSFVESVSGSGQLAGNVTITAKELLMEGGAVITAHTQGAGNAGNIIIEADDLVIGGESPGPPSSIRNDSIEGATGNAGTIDLSVGRLTLNPQSTISSVGAGGGNAGNVEVHGLGGKESKADFITLNNSAIFAFTEGQGTGGNISVAANDVTLNSFAVISAGTSSASATADGGSITFNSNQLQLNNGSSINTASVRQFPGSTTPPVTPASDAGKISLTAQSLILNGQGTNISTDTEGIGNAGAITAIVRNLTLLNGASISSSTFGAGQAGTIKMEATEALAISGGSRVSSSSFLGPGNAGEVSLTAPTITLADSFSSISSTTDNTGNAGLILIDGTTVGVTNGAIIDSSSLGAGNAGGVTITAQQQFTMEEGLISVVSVSGGGTDAGNITIAAPTVSLTGGATIDAKSFGMGGGGQVTIQARDSLLVAGTDAEGFSTGISSSTFEASNAGGITLEARTMTITGGVGIEANSFGAGQAGVVTLQAARLNITNGALVDSSTFGTGQGGSVTIMATEAMTISGSDVTGVLSEITTESRGGGGDAGQITLTTPQLQLTDARLSSTTIGAGNAGSIQLNVGQLSLGGTSMTSQALIFDGQPVSGSGGSITVFGQSGAGTAANAVSLNNSRLVTSSEGSGNAGSIALTSATDLLMRNSTVTTSAAQASGGNIKLTASNIIRIVDSNITSSVQGQAGSNGGNIDIDPQLVVIQNSQLLANANAGAGGNITIAATGAVLVDPNSRIDASAGPAGVSGSVNIYAPIQVLSGALVPLKLAYSQAGLSGDRCAADPTGQFSSFVQTGRDVVPQVPGALTPSPLSFLETLTSSSLGSPLPNLAAARLGLSSVSFADSTLFRFHSACRS